MIFDLYILNNLWALWVGLLIFFLITESLSQGFITIWLAIGSLAGLLGERLLLPFPVQLLFFAIVSVLSIIFLRPFCVRVLHSKTQATNISALIGQKALILSPLDSFQVGQAKISTQYWSAIACEGAHFASGDWGRVREIQGVKLVLEPLSSPLDAIPAAGQSQSEQVETK